MLVKWACRRTCAAVGWTKGSSGFGWWLQLPEWMLQLIMPYVASIIIHTVYHPSTFKRRPKMIREEWWAWVGNAPWVVQALTSQVSPHIPPTNLQKHTYIKGMLHMV